MQRISFEAVINLGLGLYKKLLCHAAGVGVVIIRRSVSPSLGFEDLVAAIHVVAYYSLTYCRRRECVMVAEEIILKTMDNY